MKRSFLLFLIAVLGFASLGVALPADSLNRSRLVGMAGSLKELQSGYEGSIDPAKYRVGPGDELMLFVRGVLESQVPFGVSPEGFAVVASVGEFHVAGLTLAEAQKMIVGAAQSRYPSASLAVRLLNPRIFRVSVTGAVGQRGRFLASGLMRVSDLVAMAGGGVFPEVARDTTPDGRPILPVVDNALLRGLQLIRSNGDTVLADLELFTRAGDQSSNPILNDGDMLFVPYWNSIRSTVTVSGAVGNALVIRWIPGDHLRTVLRMAGGVTPGAKGSIEWVRKVEGGGTQRTSFDLAWWRSTDIGPELQPGDQIFVPFAADLTRRGVVSIQGEVKFPGDYPVDEQTIRLSDVLQMAGGLTQRANGDELALIRRSQMAVPDAEFNRLYGLKQTEMSWTESEYLKAKRRDLEPRVVFDWKQVQLKSTDDRFNPVIHGGDLIRVPRQMLVVKVIGQVERPGLIVYQEGSNFKHYIEQSGGYTFKAYKSRIRIIKAQSGQWLKAKSSTEIEPGDTIFIPELPEVDWWKRYLDAMTILTQMATLYLVYRSASPN